MDEKQITIYSLDNGQRILDIILVNKEIQIHPIIGTSKFFRGYQIFQASESLKNELPSSSLYLLEIITSEHIRSFVNVKSEKRYLNRKATISFMTDLFASMS